VGKVAIASAVALLALATGAQAGSRLAPRPTIGPIYAQLSQVDSTTLYAVEPTVAQGARLTVVWKLTPPPANKTCRNFSTAPGQPGAPRIAMWHHAETDGCNTQDFDRHGLKGTINAVVRNADWTCTATYLGTHSGTGAYGRCVRRR